MDRLHLHQSKTRTRYVQMLVGTHLFSIVSDFCCACAALPIRRPFRPVAPCPFDGFQSLSLTCAACHFCPPPSLPCINKSPKADKAKADKLKADKDNADKLKADKDNADKLKADKAKADMAKAYKAKADMAKAYKAKAAKAKADKAKADKNKAEAAKVATAKAGEDTKAPKAGAQPKKAEVQPAPVASSASTLPSSIQETWDWRTEPESRGRVGTKCKAQIEKVYDQGHCGSCYVFAATGSMADRDCIAKVCTVWWQL